MLQIREFYIRHAEDFAPEDLRTAFLWHRETLPSADKPWSVFFYSALLIGLLDSLAFGVGGHLLSVGWKTVTLPTSLVLAGLSVALFRYHIWVYSALLKPANP